MTENMKKFLEKVSADAALAKKAMQLELADLIALAKELGFDLTDADFARPEGEISASEMEALTGGKKCLCVAAGGGTKDDDSKACGCVAAGAGYHDNGEQRCYCIMGGSGDAEKSVH